MQAQTSSTDKVPMIGPVAAAAALTLLVVCAATMQAQSWVSTATQAYPVKYLTNATMIGSLASSTPLHIVVGLQEQNANLVQPTLKRMLTPGDPLFGQSLTVQQFVQQFGPTTAQVQAVQNYLSSYGFKKITVADNQLLIEANGTAAQAEAAFNTSLVQYSLNGSIVFLNTVAARVPLSLSGTVVAVLGLNNIASLHTDLTKLSVGPQTVPCTPPLCPTPDLSNESYGPQDYQVAYDAASPAAAAAAAIRPSPDNCAPNCKKAPPCASKFAAPQLLSTGECTAVGIIAEGDLTQVVTDLRTYETK